MKLLAVFFQMEGRNYRVYRKIVYIYIYKVASLRLVVTLRHWAQDSDQWQVLVKMVMQIQVP
jgi:hypothetical protein